MNKIAIKPKLAHVFYKKILVHLDGLASGLHSPFLLKRMLVLVYISAYDSVCPRSTGIL